MYTRTGIISTPNATRSGYVKLAVRECDDGTCEYLVGESASNPNGWASLPDDLASDVRWDSTPGGRLTG
jgi:hypothetical protein